MIVFRTWEQKEPQWRLPSPWLEHGIIVGSNISQWDGNGHRFMGGGERCVIDALCVRERVMESRVLFSRETIIMFSIFGIVSGSSKMLAVVTRSSSTNISVSS